MKLHGITPKSIIKAIDASLVEMYSPEWAVVPEIDTAQKAEDESVAPHELPDRISELRREMMDAADKLDYEGAAAVARSDQAAREAGLRNCPSFAPASSASWQRQCERPVQTEPLRRTEGWPPS